MNNLSHVDLLLTAEDHTVSIKELCVDPRLQMRTEMNQETIEQYAESIQTILDEHPIEVVSIVNGSGEEDWFVVDGFHRYHAALLAEVKKVPVRMMKGTLEQAIQYAMTANWKNGMRPSPTDASRSVAMLLATADHFKYDVKAVTPWIMAFGIPKSTADKYNKDFKDAMSGRMDSKIMEMSKEGATQRVIAKEVGCDPKTVRNRLKHLAGENDSVSQIPQDEEVTPIENPFSDEELDVTPAINPADAFKQALSEHEGERKDKSIFDSPNVTLCGNDAVSGNVSGAFGVLAEAFKTHGPKAFKEFALSDSESKYAGCPEKPSQYKWAR